MPFAYNRDLQEDKEPIFDSVDQLLILLPAVSGMVRTARFKQVNISKDAAAGYSLATEIADFLSKTGVPFAEAHQVAGECVKFCEKNSIELDQMSDQQLLAIHPGLTSEVKKFLNVSGAVSSRTSAMGTSRNSVLAAINKLNQDMAAVDTKIASLRKQFLGIINP
jgi:argininosuccinate lyase